MPKYRDAAKSEMDSQRELLDSLMGINRNNDRKKDQISDFRDERVCKFFITGMCPHDIFMNTKVDEGPCQKIHSEALKAEFQRSNDIYVYDNLLEREFQGKVNEVDRVIKVKIASMELLVAYLPLDFCALHGTESATQSGGRKDRRKPQP